MKRIAALVFLLLVSPALAAEPVVSIVPATVLQGDPIMVSLPPGTSIKKATFDGKTIASFRYDGKDTVLIGIDLNKAPGSYVLRIERADGTVVERTIAIAKRERPEEPLGIPEKLGGNTTSSQQQLVSTLAKENAILAAVRTGTKAFWSAPFRYPVVAPVVTDTYGYSRLTGSYTIAHKGTDFRAREGTKVVAMNRGVVRLARTFRNYGKIVVVDHGLGVQTLYLHLSRIGVNEGELVLPGQYIGRSGQTGYAEGPHLHVSVKIGGISIDPMAFLNLFSPLDEARGQ